MLKPLTKKHTMFWLGCLNKKLDETSTLKLSKLKIAVNTSYR